MGLWFHEKVRLIFYLRKAVRGHRREKGLKGKGVKARQIGLNENPTVKCFTFREKDKRQAAEGELVKRGVVGVRTSRNVPQRHKNTSRGGTLKKERCLNTSE